VHHVLHLLKSSARSLDLAHAFVPLSCDSQSPYIIKLLRSIHTPRLSYTQAVGLFTLIEYGIASCFGLAVPVFWSGNGCRSRLNYRAVIYSKQHYNPSQAVRVSPMRVVLCDEAPFGAIMQFIALNVRASMVFHGCELGNAKN
jgi:hypothetical protein